MTTILEIAATLLYGTAFALLVLRMTVKERAQLKSEREIAQLKSDVERLFKCI